MDSGEVFVVLDDELMVAVYAARNVAERDAEVLRQEAARVRGYPVAPGEVEVRRYPVHASSRADPCSPDGQPPTDDQASHSEPLATSSTRRHLSVVRDPIDGPR